MSRPSMWRQRLAAITVLAATAWIPVGCQSTPVASRPPTVAIAVAPIAGRAPSPEHLALVQHALAPELAKFGFQLAERRELADFIVSVRYVPAADGRGGRVTVLAVERAARFREATDDGDTPEAREWRRRQREIEQWIERQHREL